MRSIGAYIIGILCSLFGINVWDFNKNVINIKGTLIVICITVLWLIIYSLIEKINKYE